MKKLISYDKNMYGNMYNIQRSIRVYIFGNKEGEGEGRG